MGRAYQNRKESMAKTAAAKTKVYSKYGREVYVTAKAGGTDPTANLALRSLIDRAKKDQVPTHVIEKALDKASGGTGEDFVLFAKSFGAYTFSVVSGVLQVIDAAIDWVQSSVEWLTFSDQTLSWQAVADGAGTVTNNAPVANVDSYSVAEIRSCQATACWAMTQTRMAMHFRLHRSKAWPSRRRAQQ